ncbi:extracellular solute-binding protein [Pelolinea submarina]|uniref:Putative spermidine/putrescine transport system substrate-binding protein n=1 Tax=Pelolinea submarina TaxID=913107 RepID=A0A347ZWU3_9CHLR|nr:ABC transporter substrate-binding protein [Pelolinea submarina]REG05517.1 putative spermidine/putrescine transport system substrate-binding protein [Pelolinea submarina]BBB49774.1 spermidine/putrescine transport system substrate-binding protein [Pelolinea submarina]
MSKYLKILLGLLVVVSLGLSACATSAPAAAEPAAEEPAAEEPAAAEEAAPAEDPMAALIAAAQGEGKLVSYGLPDSWVNYGGMKTLLNDMYGIPTEDTDMGSGEIIAALEAEATAPVADITDLGLNFAKIVEDEGLSQAYKNAYWDEIPDYAKDPDGRWSAAYWGAIAFLVNADAVTTVPTTWTDLLNDEYVGKVCMKDPRSSSTANMVVLGAAYGMGGDETNVQPGLDFFQQMIEKGILNGVKPSTAAIQKGECPVSLFWDFDGLSSKEENPDMNLQVVIPSEGTVAGMYIQFVTAGAPHANAAKLMIELEYSDEGQIAYANGFVHPVRTSVTLPDELLAKFPPEKDYEAATFPKDYVALDSAGTAISDGWELIAQ